tara:strand:+ start:1976 stop:3217 length:1242 start_codon:yes stop_codon:yes gene_type:complete
MTVNKGLKSLVESTPNFSNQALENSINGLKIGWVAKSIELDTAITNNSVLTTTQKNDVKDTINNVAYLNAGRYLNDMVRHTNKILDGSIIPGNPDISSGEDGQGTFREILQLVQGLQSTITEQFGVTPAEKNRDVNDHLGILNNKFTATEDSSRAVFTSMKEAITFINTGALAQDTAYQTALTNLKNFISSVVGDSTDFQQTLNTFASAVASAATAFDTPLQSGEYASRRTQLINDRNSIVTQQTLENSNITSLRTFTESLSDNSAYIGLADDPELRKLMAKVAQNSNWVTYFNDYEKNQSYSNPIYNTNTDSDKTSTIELVLESKGLPDVTDHLDFEAVANKTKRDTRIDNKNYDYYSIEEIITKSCEQLGIITANRLIEDQSKSLLTNMNKNDRDIVADELDQNEDANTLS